MGDYKLDLDHALQLADVADGITMRVYRSSDMNVQTKPDHTPVTKGDLEVEKRLSEIVVETFKEGYLGEEGTRIGADNRIWMVDPIDGTRNFLRHMPIWGTLISLQEHGETVAACVSAPALGRRWWATKGGGAWTRDVDGVTRRIHVSQVANMADAFMLAASIYSWDKTPVGHEPLLQLVKDTWRYRALGDFFNYMMVAEGAADVCIEADPKAWDLAAPSLIIREAGGAHWTDTSESAAPSEPRISIGTNGKLETAVRQTLGL